MHREQLLAHQDDLADHHGWAGVGSSASRTFSTFVESVPVTTRGALGRRGRDDGDGPVAGADSRHVLHDAVEAPQAIRKTTVPPAAANARHVFSRGSPSAVAPTAVMTLKWVETPRWVTGIPTEPAAATELLMPGTTSTSTPCSARKRASSPPRPKTNGSPPFNRTTVLPASASLSSSRFVTDWCVCRPPPILPTSIMRASRRELEHTLADQMVVQHRRPPSDGGGTPSPSGGPGRPGRLPPGRPFRASAQALLCSFSASW